MRMTTSYKHYRFYFCLSRPFIWLFYRLRVVGAENIPSGATLVCANHSSNVDPFLLAYAFSLKHQLHILAKNQLFKIPIISTILRKAGMISVDRNHMDTTSVKSSLAYLKNDEKILIFPEGTRVSSDDASTAKSGAVKLAERTGAPILPVYIPRKKRLFSRVPIIIGEPYYIEKDDQKRKQDDYDRLSDALMDAIMLLEEGI